MNPKPFSLRPGSPLAGWWFLLWLWSVPVAQGAETPAEPGISGLWMWSLSSQNGQTIETTVRLKVEDGKLIGSLPGTREREAATPLEDVTLKGDEVSFKLTREREGQKHSTTYIGRLSGNTIQGRMQFLRDGETRSRSWEATRQKEVPPPRPQGFFGEWKYSVTLSGDDKIDLSLNLRRDKDEWTGYVKFGEIRTPISDVRREGDEIIFTVVWDRDGEKHTSKYRGRRNGDIIKGKIESDYGGKDQTYEWLAKRP